MIVLETVVLFRLKDGVMKYKRGAAALLAFTLVLCFLCFPLLPITIKPYIDYVIPVSGPGNLTASPLPNPTIQAALLDVDAQLRSYLTANIAYIKPESMKMGETTVVELLLDPSLSQPELAAQVAERGGFVTSIGDPDTFMLPEGGEIIVVTGSVEITDRMKATLIAHDPEAFVVREISDSAEQVVSTVDTTKWRWSVTAKAEGTQTLELVLYRLIKYDGQEYWREVVTYKADIVVWVTPVDRIKSVDWKWIVGIIVTMLLIPAFWRWFDKRKSSPTENVEQPAENQRKK